MESFVSSGYIHVHVTFPIRQVAKVMINSILEFCNDVKQRKGDSVDCTH